MFQTFPYVGKRWQSNVNCFGSTNTGHFIKCIVLDTLADTIPLKLPIYEKYRWNCYTQTLFFANLN